MLLCWVTSVTATRGGAACPARLKQPPSARLLLSAQKLFTSSLYCTR
jgi:hypothetical protein